MLVLTRNRGQQIVIGDNITVTVQRVKGNRVTLSIEAPDNVHILRGELTSYRQEWNPADDGVEVNGVEENHATSTTPAVATR